MIHVIYATDKRTEFEKSEKPMLTIKAQLHDMEAGVDKEDPNILYAAEWDGVSTKVEVLKGNIADIKMAYLGWPMVAA